MENSENEILSSKSTSTSPHRIHSDEYNTVFTKRLTEPNLNSTIRNDDLSNEDTNDYSGGLLEDWKSIHIVSDNPSDASSGFENTFKVLTNQVRQPRISNVDIQNLLRCNFLSNKSADTLDVPKYDRFLRAISEESSTSDYDRDESPSYLELELEARQRIRELSNGSKKTNISVGDGDIKLPLSEHLYGVELSSKSSEKIETPLTEDIKQQCGDYPEYVYHVAKENGRLYLKVVRSLLIDKVLCGNRVSQMTRTYDDIEAVTRLLEEKEKDLELTVQIGKELLTQNNRLENRVAELEGEVKVANENLAQLTYEVHTKSALLAALTNDEEGGSESSTPVLAKSFNLDLLQRKISNLEVENKSLRAEATQLVKETDAVEEAERKLMEDITLQLNQSHYQYDGMNLELERYKEENKLQHEQILNLTAKLTEAELRLHQLTCENEEQISRLSITEENQNLLASELAEFKARYQEVLSLLQETQEQLRNQRKRGQPMVRSNFIPGIGMGCAPVDSLQSELMESSLFSDNSLDSGIASDRGGIGSGRNVPGYKKVFETVRCVSKTGQFSDGMSQLGAMSLSSSSQTRMSSYAYPGSGHQSNHGGSVYSASTYPSSMGAKSYSRDSLTSDSEDNYPAKAPQGVPGAPGAKDLEAALKRLTPATVLARRSMLSNAPPGTYNYDEGPSGGMPLGIRTPDSIMSTGSSGLSGISSNHWRLPEKLQIVKPMEGSQTLHHWNRLATPTLSGLLDERPGVTIRGGRGLDELGLHMYSLSDVEEDADDMAIGKQFQTYGSVYTFTNSTVMHPDDGMSVTSSLPQSQMSSRLASVSSSRHPSPPQTPRHSLSRRNSCSTFSVNSGLASMLNERGIKAVTPSALNTPAGPNYSPTVTPCNSPEGSPTRSRSPERDQTLLTGFISSGADMLRRKIVGETTIRPSRPMSARNKVLLSRQEQRALRSIRLMEKVESLGLDNIISSHQPVGISPLALQGSPSLTGARSRTASPMAQLTSLKNISRGEDGYAFDRGSIRSALSQASSDIDSDTNSEFSTTSSIDRTEGNKSSTSKTVAHHPSPSRNAGQTTSQPIDGRLKQMQRQKSRRGLINGANGQRPDLGTVAGKVRPDLGKVSRSNNESNSRRAEISESPKKEERPTIQQSVAQSFVGSISSLFFGRKGGLS